MKQIKECFILAVTIHNREKMYVLHEILDTIKKLYSDCKIFIGINYQSLPDTELVIDSYNLNCQYERLTDEYMYSVGDESAYQIALKLMSRDSEKFDLMWFMHTKGGHNNRDLDRRLYLNNFLTKRSEIRSNFSKLDGLGVYGYRCIKLGPQDPNNPVIIDSNIIADFWSPDKSKIFLYPPCPVILIETMFCMRGSIIYKFIDTYPNFFQTKIRKYFFEAEMCNYLPTRMGYFPATILGSHIDIFNNENLEYLIDNWIYENNLLHLSEYKNLIRGLI